MIAFTSKTDHCLQPKIYVCKLIMLKGLTLYHSRDSPMQREIHSPRMGALLGTSTHRHIQQQRQALNGCKDVEAILVNLESFCHIYKLQPSIWDKISWSSCCPPLYGMSWSHFQLIWRLHHFCYRQVSEQWGYCTSGYSSARHMHTEKVHLHQVPSSNSSTQSVHKREGSLHC